MSQIDWIRIGLSLFGGMFSAAVLILGFTRGVERRLDRLTQTVYGEKGENGLIGIVRSLRGWRMRHVKLSAYFKFRIENLEKNAGLPSRRWSDEAPDDNLGEDE